MLCDPSLLAGDNINDTAIAAAAAAAAVAAVSYYWYYCEILFVLPMNGTTMLLILMLLDPSSLADGRNDNVITVSSYWLQLLWDPFLPTFGNKNDAAPGVAAAVSYC